MSTRRPRENAGVVYLSTPCATPDCGHPYNWHQAGRCTAGDCRCIAFAAPTPGAPDTTGTAP